MGANAPVDFYRSVDTERYLERQLRALLGDEDANRRIASFTGAWPIRTASR